MRLSSILSETLLYRGDSKKIDAFDIEKTDAGSLLGPGIYLTNDPAVAGDYTAARGTERVFPNNRYDGGDYKTPKDLINAYVMSKSIAVDEESFLNEWLEKNGFESRFDVRPEDVARYRSDLAQAKQAQVKISIEKVRKELPMLRVQKQTTGELVLVRKNRPGAIAVFDIPESYMDRTLHADCPLPDAALEAMKTLWFASFKDGRGDMRDRDENFVSFDDYVAGYKTRGTRYAWRNDEDGNAWIGGKGENPSLDDLMNGTHGGYHAYKDGTFDDRTKSTALIKALMDLGYVGLEYDGGLRVAGHNRGGGGRRHRAFVFWDVAELSKFRIADGTLPATKRMNVRSLPEVPA